MQKWNHPQRLLISMHHGATQQHQTCDHRILIWFVYYLYLQTKGLINHLQLVMDKTVPTKMTAMMTLQSGECFVLLT